MSKITFSSFERNKRLSSLSTFQIGGVADYYIEIKEIPQLFEVLNFCKVMGLKYHIVGKGSNSLFSDQGFRGLVIGNKLDFLEIEESQFRVGAGFSFSLLGIQSAKKGFSGLEFASGIPASVGGAVYMNAGASGSEVKDHLYSVEYLHDNAVFQLYKKEELHFGYRHSSFQEMKGIILAATFKLFPSSDAREKQLQIIQYRKNTQPLWQPSVGCVFQNPGQIVQGACLSAGALIEKAGLKGLRVGGIQVSEVHANFIVNTGNGTALDVIEIIKIIKQKVFDQFGVELKEEVRLIDE